MGSMAGGSRARLRGALRVAASAAAFGALPIFARRADAAGVDLRGAIVIGTAVRLALRPARAG
jgi:hypothetical protein